MAKTALLFGSTGLIGSLLLEELLKDPGYDSVKIFVRQHLSLKHPKLRQIIIDFHDLNVVKAELSGDVLFSCLGTTIKTTPSKEVRRFVDYEIPVQLAAICEEQKIETFMVVSSVGASAASSNFYLRTKGEMEADVSRIHIPRIVLMQPSFILGSRAESRGGERIFGLLFRGIAPLMFGSIRKYRPISGLQIARAMVSAVNNKPGISILHYDEMK